MKKYEIMFIVKPDLEEASITAVANSMKELLNEKGAKIVEEKAMGQRELAYEIQKYKTGYYFLFVIEAKDNEATKEFDRVALINENILRHLIIKVEER
ncbi:MAG: 30S ribosomal protein S6 [Bacilli bacterium]